MGVSSQLIHYKNIKWTEGPLFRWQGFKGQHVLYAVLYLFKETY